MTQAVQSEELSEPVDGTAGDRRPWSVFWPAIWLGLILMIAKGFNLHRFKGSTVWQWLGDLMTASAADVLFVAGWAVLGGAMFWATARWRRVRRGVVAVWMVLSCGFAVYAVVSVQVYEFLRTPLTYPLLYIANDLGNMRSSIGAFMTAGLIVGVIAAPAGLLLLTWIGNRWLRFRAGKWGGALRALPLMFVAWQVWFAGQTMGRWIKLPDKRLVQSPHWVFLRSCGEQLIGAGRTVRLAGDYPPEFRSDFASVAERAPGENRRSTLTIPARPRNVFLIVLESIGVQHMGLYGGKFDTTPRLVAESRHAIVFDEFHAHQGMSANSLFNMLTSTYTPISWMHFTLERPDAPGTTIAQVLRSRGYRTAYMTSTDTKWADFRKFLSGRGFDSIADFRDMGGAAEKISSWTVEDRALIDHAMKWLDENAVAAEPFFLMMWTGQGHHPYSVRGSAGQPLVEFVKDRREDAPAPEMLNRYLNVIRQTDHHIGRLLDFLRDRGLAEDTLVIVTGDHGEAFGYPRELYGHGLQIYQEIVHVPLILWNPRAFPAGARDSKLGGHVDLAPTVLEALGVDEVPGSWQGRSLFDAARTDRVYHFAAGFDYLLGIREGGLKYILNATTGRDELYDLDADAKELTNTAEGMRERTKVFRQRLSAWADDQEKRAGEMRRREKTTPAPSRKKRHN